MDANVTNERRRSRSPRGVGVWLPPLLSLFLSGCLFFGGSSPRSDPGEETSRAPGDDIAALRAEGAFHPNEPYWPYRAGVLLVERDSLAAAEDAFTTALLRDPVYVPALTALAGLYYETARYREGVRLLADARMEMEASGTGVSPEILEGLALHREALDDLDGAREALASAEASGGRVSPSVGVYLGLRGSDFRQVAEPARREAEGDPKSPVALNNLGVATLQGGDPIRARELFGEAHELDPDLPGPLYNLALLEEFYLMDHEAAAEWFRRYQRLSRADPDNLREVFLGTDSGATNSMGEQ